MERSQRVVENLRTVLRKISELSADNQRVTPPRLVAVGKTFPAELVEACYADGQRDFGENYVQELMEKSEKLATNCPAIRWHFIGTLQSNKIRKLCELPNLWCIETLSSRKHCDHLQKTMEELKRQINVFIQVHTSNEESKGGLLPGDAPSLATYVFKECPNLKLLGLMTIGSLKESSCSTKNADFEKLRECRHAVSKELGCTEEDLELSMGMSKDYDLAIQYGSTNLRVGSTIFGERHYDVNK